MQMPENSNPYAAPPQIPHAGGGPFRYSDLPQRCPRCERPFPDAFFARRFKRKYRWSTIAYFVSLVFVYLLLGALFGNLIAIFLVFWLAAWGMSWAKKVTLHCLACHWKQTYIVAGRARR